MSNQVSIPAKKAYPARLREASRSYLQENHPDTHPDAFKWDISHWEELRNDAMDGVVHVSKTDALLKCVLEHPAATTQYSCLPAQLPRAAGLHANQTARRRRYAPLSVPAVI